LARSPRRPNAAQGGQRHGVCRAGQRLHGKGGCDRFATRPNPFYRFASGTLHSPIGRTKTLPVQDVAQVELAVFSCSNYPAGYFHVYADAAKHNDIDAALHIGDYIYEYERTGYACGNAKKFGGYRNGEFAAGTGRLPLPLCPIPH